MPVGEPEVELGEQRARVIRACDRSIVAPQGTAVGRVHPDTQGRVNSVDILLFGFIVNLLVICDEEKRAVVLDWSAQRKSELMLLKIGLVGESRMNRRTGDRVILAEIMQRATDLIGDGLRNHVDETA